jgi:hypothetical protein
MKFIVLYCIVFFLNERRIQEPQNYVDPGSDPDPQHGPLQVNFFR